nr:reverse transcriptase domain-containing protein [Tanacetum cinerariifolium]
NAAKDENPECLPACCRITRREERVYGLVEVEGVEDLGKENVKDVLVNGNRVGYSYKEFLACNPKEYDGKGGAVVLTRWIKKMKNVQDMSGCSID